MEGFDARPASGTGYPQTLARLCEKGTCIGGRELSICDAPRRKYEGFEADIETKKSSRAQGAGAVLY